MHTLDLVDDNRIRTGRTALVWSTRKHRRFTCTRCQRPQDGERTAWHRIPHAGPTWSKACAHCAREWVAAAPRPTPEERPDQLNLF